MVSPCECDLQKASHPKKASVAQKRSPSAVQLEPSAVQSNASFLACDSAISQLVTVLSQISEEPNKTPEAMTLQEVNWSQMLLVFAVSSTSLFKTSQATVIGDGLVKITTTQTILTTTTTK